MYAVVVGLVSFSATRCDALAVLLLDHNDLESLPEDFAGLFPALRTLDASGNKLRTLPKNLGALDHLRIFGNPPLVDAAAIAARVAWVDESLGGAFDAATRVVRVAVLPDCPYPNVFLRRKGRCLVVAFAVGGGRVDEGLGQFSGVVHRAGGGDVDFLSVMDAPCFSSFTTRRAAFDAWLETFAAGYDVVSLLGSSRGGFGALLHARHANCTLAFSPMKHRRQMSPDVFDVFEDSGSTVLLFVGRRNADDLRVATTIAARLGARAEVVGLDADGHGAAALFPDRAALDAAVGRHILGS